MFLIGIEKLSFLVHASLLLIASSGECCAPCNFVLPVMLGGTHVFTSSVMERQILEQIHVKLYPPKQPH